jgi:16S rRNA G966 N2-methylase RsmD
VNRLYFGDNLKWLRDAREFPDASVDLVYLDPPFNSTPARTSPWSR